MPQPAASASGPHPEQKHRLVVVGEPGAGKTVLGLLLILGLLASRAEGGPVPVLLPVSSWDPLRERLEDWLVRTMAEPYYNGRSDIPRTLLDHGLLLPILDGLDEIPESARRGAIRAINKFIAGDRPVVVTCRVAEYEELIRGGAPTLWQAAVVEVLPVAPRDLISYLQEVDWPAGVDWSPVFAHLRAAPDSPLSAALSTPLMVTSARLVYQRGGGDPGELLDRDRFTCAHAIEDHLMDRMVDAAYARGPEPDAFPAPDRSEGRASWERWNAEQARRWLTFLACHLHDHRERDLAWWKLSRRLLPWWLAPMIGLAVAVLLFELVLRGIGSNSRPLALLFDLVFGGTSVLLFVGVGAVFAFVSSRNPVPGRVTWSLRDSADRLAQGFRAGMRLTVLFAVPVMCVLTLTRVTDQEGPGSTLQAVEFYYEGAAVSLAHSALPAESSPRPTSGSTRRP